MADDAIKSLGDQIANLTLKQAKELSDYLKEEYKIEPAAAGAMMMAAPAAAGPAAVAEQSEFDVVLTGVGDKKLDVVKEVKTITGLALMEAKKLVDNLPAKIKEKAGKDDAAKFKAALEKVGATVELK